MTNEANGDVPVEPNSTAAIASLRAGARLQGTLYGAVPAPPRAERESVEGAPSAASESENQPTHPDSGANLIVVQE